MSFIEIGQEIIAWFSRAELLRRNQLLTACANLDVAAGKNHRRRSN